MGEIDDNRQVVIELLPSTELGGAEIAVLSRLQTLHETGRPLKTHLVDLGPTSGRLAPALARRADMHQMPRKAHIGWSRRLIRALDPTVVVCHSPRAAVLVWISTRFLRSKPPYVVVAHDTLISEDRLKAALLGLPLWLANRSADLLLAVSTAAARGPWARGARNVEVSILGSQLIFNGDVDIEGVWPEETSIRLLAMSRFTRKKNYTMLIDALAYAQCELREVGAVCAIVGYGPTGDSLKDKITRLGVDDIVRIVPATTAPGSILIRADVFLIPSIAEGGPLTLYEALLAGCRVASTNVGVVPDIIGASEDAGLSMIDGVAMEVFADAILRLCLLGSVTASERDSRRARFAHLDSTSCAIQTQSKILSVARP